MSALRLGRLPNGLRDIRIEEPAVGRLSMSRLAIRGGGAPVVGAFVTGEGQRSRDLRLQREAGARSRAAK